MPVVQNSDGFYCLQRQYASTASGRGTPLEACASLTLRPAGRKMQRQYCLYDPKISRLQGQATASRGKHASTAPEFRRPQGNRTPLWGGVPPRNASRLQGQKNKLFFHSKVGRRTFFRPQRREKVQKTPRRAGRRTASDPRGVLLVLFEGYFKELGGFCYLFLEIFYQK